MTTPLVDSPVLTEGRGRGGSGEEVTSLVVRIQEARNLPLRKKSKKNPSSYIVLRCGTEKGKTNIDKDSRDPTWGQIFRFGGARQGSGHLNLSGEVVQDVKIKNLEKLAKDKSKTSFYVNQRVKAKYKRHKTMCPATVIDIDESKGRCTIRYDAVKEMRVMVYDSSGVMGKDQLLGEVKIKISDVMKTQTKKITNWYKLVGGDGNVGDVLLTLQLRGESPRWLRTMESKEKARMSRILAKQSEANLLELVVYSARSLLGDRYTNEPDLEDDITSIKPSCSITVDNCDEKGTVCTSRTSSYTSKTGVFRGVCSWQQRFQFVCLDDSAMIHVNVEDEDTGLDFGGITIPVSKYRSLDAEPRTDILVASKKTTKEEKTTRTSGGILEYAVRWYYDPETTRAKIMTNVKPQDLDEDEKEHVLENNDLRTRDDVEEDEIEMERRREEEERIEALENMEVKSGSYQVAVHIIEVRDLKPEDPNGTSDPVVRNSSRTLKTRTQTQTHSNTGTYRDRWTETTHRGKTEANELRV